ncbi:transcriptional regulator, TetR family [Saccharopolyspora kobensis]|uniref:Transcriptional regulator, TetR family n=1 Tax=Saccharopolyspora kobensis TaxID=146035 RepID=A0A1H5SXJ9_9PSEU|nr:TetR/AcrR family transcriptional regulator [Saccharopolyspora kobensis]SEF55239.1 transcriptional regulator, TetR family [Saccharopolyspora kobensis]SFC52693.1 transcriptional regulator, TetR family [Saccharopolyspora kobensis]
MGPKSADRGREVRQRLLEAAAELIAERGWGAVSTRMVAERADVGAGLVHYHFASVQVLLSAAAVGVMRDVGASLEPLLERADTPAEALQLLLTSLDRYTGDDAVSVLFAETYLAATRDPALRGQVAEVLAEFSARLGGWLAERGVAEAGTTAAVVGSAIDGLMMQRALHPGLTADAVLPVLARLVETPGGAG